MTAPAVAMVTGRRDRQVTGPPILGIAMDMSSSGGNQHRRRRTAPALLLCALAAVTTVSGSARPHQSAAGHPAAAAAAPVPAVAPVVIPVPPPAAPKPPGPPHDYVAPAVPTAMTFRARTFTIKAHVCAMAAVFPLDPPGEQHHTVCWVGKGFGFKPGSRTATSYVIGHSWAPDPQEVLNQISERATREILHERPVKLDGVSVYPVKSLIGARLTLVTPKGRLVYAVRSGYGVDKGKFGGVKRTLNQHVHNRVILITCSEGGGHDYYYNIVLDTRLVSSVSATARSDGTVEHAP